MLVSFSEFIITRFYNMVNAVPHAEQNADVALFTLPQVVHFGFDFTVTACSTGLLSGVSPSSRKTIECFSVSVGNQLVVWKVCSLLLPGTVIPTSLQLAELHVTPS